MKINTHLVWIASLLFTLLNKVEAQTDKDTETNDLSDLQLREKAERKIRMRKDIQQTLTIILVTIFILMFFSIACFVFNYKYIKVDYRLKKLQAEKENEGEEEPEEGENIQALKSSDPAGTNKRVAAMKSEEVQEIN